MIQEKLYKEIRDKSIFKSACNAGNRYLEEVFSRNVFPEEEALNNLDLFSEELQDEFVSSEVILERLNQAGSPATVAQTGGRYFGFVNGSVVPAGLAARLLSDFWDQNTGLQVMSPVSSKLETVVQTWLRELFGLGNKTTAGFVSGTSMATFCGLAAARYRILKNNGWDINTKGLFGAPPIRVVAGKGAHSTVYKAIGLLGLGTDNVEFVEADSQGRLKTEELPELDSNTILILQAGNVNTGAFDNFNYLCGKAKERGAWVHIDGAFGLWAKAVPELEHLTRGMEKANSWSVDGHKTLNTPYDSGIIMCSDEDALVSALHMSGDYIIPGGSRDGMFYTPEMSRRSRIIELWATMKSLGKTGIAEMILNMNLRAKQFARELKENNFEVLNDVVFNQVIVRCKNNKTTLDTLKNIQEQRVCWCGNSKWQNKDVIRISVCSWATTEEDVKLSVESFVRARDSVSYDVN